LDLEVSLASSHGGIDNLERHFLVEQATRESTRLRFF
jgi:hypothetical protein